MNKTENIPKDPHLRKDAATISAMFGRIVKRYDALNLVLSFGFVNIWRTQVLRKMHSYANNSAQKLQNLQILDIACGTGKLCHTLAAIGAQVTGVDISDEMISYARKAQIAREVSHNTSFMSKKRTPQEAPEGCVNLDKRGLGVENPRFLQADAQSLPFSDDQFDCVVISFGIRNMEKVDVVLQETLRVLRPGGMYIVCEFFMPQKPFIKWFYTFYMRFIVPIFVRIFAADQHAYRYLFASIRSWVTIGQMRDTLLKAGFVRVEKKLLTGGIVGIICAHKEGQLCKDGERNARFQGARVDERG